MNPGFSEDVVEHAGIETLKDLGWLYLPGSAIAPDGPAPQRPAFSDVILIPRLARAIVALNPAMPEAARAEALRRVMVSESGSLVEENRRLHALITGGVDVEYRAADGRIAGDKAWLIDSTKP